MIGGQVCCTYADFTMHQLITTDQLVWAIVTADIILTVPPLVLSAQRVQFASQCVVLFDTLKCKIHMQCRENQGRHC